MSSKILYSMSPVAAAVSAALAAPGAAIAQESTGDTLDEIIVTARKYDENLQAVPASVQAIPEAMLMEMGALNTEDYVRFLPSVNWINFNSGGSNRIVFRGVSTGTSNFIATSSSSVYLDDLPMTATNGSQPDVRMMDVARVEALNGPQGTLFGASAQAGTLRIITNQPDPSHFEASVDAMVRSGSTSDASHSITAVLNLPLVEDVFALRIAIQTAEDGGYIDNMLGNMPDTWYGETNVASAAADPLYGWGVQRLDWGNTLDNASVAGENWNKVEYTNFRIGLRWDINEDWSTTLSYNYGDTEAQAGSDYNPFVGDLQTVQWAKDLHNDDWDMTSLVIEGDLGFAQFVSSTSFFDRVQNFSHDATIYYKYYTNWNCEDRGAAPSGYWDNPDTNRGIYYPLYCAMPNASPSGDPTQQAEFVGLVEGPSFNDRFSQEIRLSHQGETFDWLAGLYYEDSSDNWDAVWMKGANDFQGTHAARYLETLYPNEDFSDSEFLWLSADRTEWEQKAVFGEVTWHINDEINLTVGARWFETTNTKVYRKYHGGKHVNGFAEGVVPQAAWDVDTGGAPATGTISETVPKVAFSWNFDDDKMLFATYSEGFRTGGVNRTNPNVNWDITAFGQTWEPDKLGNSEIGIKSRWADNTVQFNASYFYMDWTDLQLEVIDPSSGDCLDPTDPGPCSGPAAQPWLKIVGNAGDAHSSGIQADFAWIPAEGWDVGANAQWLEAEIDEAPPELAAATGIVAGMRLPLVPDFQGSAWASYTWPVNFVQGGEMFVRAQYSHTGETTTALVPRSESGGSPSFTNDSYSIGDFRIGLISNDGNWQVDAFVNNIGDERAQVYQGGSSEWQWGRQGQYDRVHHVYTIRPREYGMRFSMRWGE